MFQRNVVEEIRTDISGTIMYLFENCAVYEIM